MTKRIINDDQSWLVHNYDKLNMILYCLPNSPSMMTDRGSFYTEVCCIFYISSESPKSKWYNLLRKLTKLHFNLQLFNLLLEAFFVYYYLIKSQLFSYNISNLLLVTVPIGIFNVSAFDIFYFAFDITDIVCLNLIQNMLIFISYWHFHYMFKYCYNTA